MINKSIDSITRTDIESLVLNLVAESRTLEYKEKLPGNSDEDKKEFLKDVSAFANTSGGDIIYGISEQRDGNGKTTGLPDQIKGLSGINADEQKRRLDSILQDALDPRIPGIRIEAIDGFTDGSIIIIRVPKSWNSPHMVVFKNSSRFFARNSAGAYQLDVTEIRSAFIASESLAERIRQFRSDRIAKIIADETPVPLETNPKMVLHVAPISSFTSGSNIGLSLLGNRPLDLRPIYTNGWNHRYNFDGLLTYSAFKEPVCHTYAQIFHNGAIEAVDAFMLSPRHNGEKLIYSVGYEEELIKALHGYLQLHKNLEFNPPSIVMLSLLGVKGYRMSAGRSWFDRGQTIDRDVLLVPEVVVEDYGLKASAILRPAFDTVWQACGWDRSKCYDDQGIWVGIE